MRHKEVERCPVGATAMYLFYRFQVENETPPNTLCNEEWYDTYLLQVDQRTTSLRATLAKKNLANVKAARAAERAAAGMRVTEADAGNHSSKFYFISSTNTTIILEAAITIAGGLTGDVMRKFHIRAYDKCGITSSKITHLVRGVAAREAEQAGVDGGQINRHGGRFF